MEGSTSKNYSSIIEGYLLIPHELLHVVGYWIIGKRCHYRLGDRIVKPIDFTTNREQLWGMLFPFVVFGILFVGCIITSGLAYRWFVYGASFGWFILWTSLALIMGIYTGSTITDLRQAYLLVFNKPWYAETPFDIFFWPLVDWEKVRKEALEKEKDDEQS